jgi:hypothetical protein
MRHAFLPITKVDRKQRLVHAAGQGDFAKMQAWSDEFWEATRGKSLGNVRAMGGQVAAGKLTSLQFDAATRQIKVIAKIVDDDEWQKIEQGVYTGFRVDGDGISIVDTPVEQNAELALSKAECSSAKLIAQLDAALADFDARLTKIDRAMVSRTGQRQRGSSSAGGGVTTPEILMLS